MSTPYLPHLPILPCRQRRSPPLRLGNLKEFRSAVASSQALNDSNPLNGNEFLERIRQLQAKRTEVIQKGVHDLAVQGSRWLEHTMSHVSETREEEALWNCRWGGSPCTASR